MSSSRVRDVLDAPQDVDFPAGKEELVEWREAPLRHAFSAAWDGRPGGQSPHLA
ncbi:hypothetical protein ABZ467_03775 [Streptomyces sp. NPDC005727]|uniref:hypothetical protein n=1 Tax=Streptomyces sp. NPDC005727 TaxID=3157053 RepID=UPI0033D2B484